MKRNTIIWVQDIEIHQGDHRQSQNYRERIEYRAATKEVLEKFEAMKPESMNIQSYKKTHGTVLITCKRFEWIKFLEGLSSLSDVGEISEKEIQKLEGQISIQAIGVKL